MTALDRIVKNHPVKNTGEIQRFASLNSKRTSQKPRKPKDRYNASRAIFFSGSSHHYKWHLASFTSVNIF